MGKRFFLTAIAALFLAIPGSLAAQCGAQLQFYTVYCNTGSCQGQTTISTITGAGYQLFYNVGASCCGRSFPFFVYLAECPSGAIKSDPAVLASLTRLQAQGIKLLVASCTGDLVPFAGVTARSAMPDFGAARARDF